MLKPSNLPRFQSDEVLDPLSNVHIDGAVLNIERIPLEVELAREFVMKVSPVHNWVMGSVEISVFTGFRETGSRELSGLFDN